MPKKRKSAEGLTLSELRRLKKKRKRTRKKITITILLLIGIFIGLLFTPLFDISDINIIGNNKVTYEEILDSSGFRTEENIFSFNLSDAGENISKIPYINSVLIERILPSTIEISVTESIPMAYILCMDFYIVIDKYGKALEVKGEDVNYNIPILSDFEINEFYLGEKIIVDNEEKFKKTLEILKDLYNNNFIDRVKSISFLNDDIIFDISDDLTINMGEYDQFNSKILMIKEVVLKLPADAKGIINAKNANNVYFSGY